MSYQENIRRTQIELAVSLQRQSSWPDRMKTSTWARLDKLHQYSRRAGNTSFDLNAVPSVLGVNVGYASKKLKAKMLEADSFHLGQKRPKVSRTWANSFMFPQGAGGRLVLKDKAVPTEPFDPITVDRVVKILVLRNNKKGSLTFFTKEDQHVATIPYRYDDTLSSEEAVAAWANLAIRNSRGDIAPFFSMPRPNRFSQTPVIKEQ